MKPKCMGMEAEVDETPAIVESSTVYRYNPNLYITNASSDCLQQLRNEPIIRDFAAVKPDTYELIKKTNRTLLMFVDLAKRIMEGSDEQW